MEPVESRSGDGGAREEQQQQQQVGKSMKVELGLELRPSSRETEQVVEGQQTNWLRISAASAACAAERVFM